MPVKEFSGPDRTSVIVGAASILGLIAMVFLASRILNLASDGELQVSADQQVFVLEDAEQWAKDIAERGPVAFPDATGRDRDIYLQHIGEDEKTGWYAFGVRPRDAPTDCVAIWQPDSRTFVDSCDGTVFPEDGEGLPSYPVEYSDGDLVIDINAESRLEADSGEGD